MRIVSTRDLMNLGIRPQRANGAIDVLAIETVSDLTFGQIICCELVPPTGMMIGLTISHQLGRSHVP